MSGKSFLFLATFPNIPNNQNQGGKFNKIMSFPRRVERISLKDF